MRPVGPLPARVYWVRRAIIAALALLVLLAASWVWGAASGDDPEEVALPVTSSPAASPSDSASPAGSSSPSASNSPSPTASASPSPTASKSEAKVCADSVIAVTAKSDRTTYASGQNPKFTLTITNTSKKTCTRDVGQKANELFVKQGDTLIWSSDHCAPGGSAKVVSLPAGQSYVTGVAWSRTESSKGCPKNPDDAPPGTYALTGRNLTVVSKPQAFALA